MKTTIEVMDESRGPVWKTQNGREIPIDEIHDSHLINIINKIRRDTARSAVGATFRDQFVETYDGDRELIKGAMRDIHVRLHEFVELTAKMAPNEPPVRAWNFVASSKQTYSILLEDPDGHGPWHALAMRSDKGYVMLWEQEVLKRGDVILDELLEDGGKDPRVE